MITKQANRYQHQLEAAAKVIQNGGVGGLHHDVGCGKTITVFDVFEYLKRREPDLRLLVVAPLNILEAQGWGDKLKDWTCWNYYNCHALQGHYQRDSREIDIYLINYASLIGKKHQDRLLRLLERFEFLGVLDESHRIKNPKSQRTKVVNGYYKGRKWIRGHREYFKYRMILTGTAAPNNPTEWFSQCLFLSEDIFGRRITNFRSKYFYLERTGWDGEIQTVDVTGNIGDQMKKGYRLKLIPQLSQEFYHRIEQYVHFVKADDAIDLPDEVDEVRPVGMAPEQAKLYRKMQRDLVIEFNETDEVTASYALTKLQKLNQLANGFVIDDSGKTHVVGTRKNDELVELVDEMGKRQIIIWSQYVKQIELLLERLGDQAIGLKGHDRNDVMREFASGNKKCLVMNPSSGSEGLDLQFASVEIFASLNHSWMDYYQCRGRIRRPGQKNKCLYIHMLSDSTIEEHIYLSLRDKEDQQEIAHGFIQRIKSANKNRKVDSKKLQPVGGVQA